MAGHSWVGTLFSSQALRVCLGDGSDDALSSGRDPEAVLQRLWAAVAVFAERMTPSDGTLRAQFLQHIAATQAATVAATVGAWQASGCSSGWRGVSACAHIPPFQTRRSWQPLVVACCLCWALMSSEQPSCPQTSRSAMPSVHSWQQPLPRASLAMFLFSTLADVCGMVGGVRGGRARAGCVPFRRLRGAAASGAA